MLMISEKLMPPERLHVCFYAIPSQLNNNASRYMVSSVVNNARIDTMEELLQDMEDSMVVSFSYHVNDPYVGLLLLRGTLQYKMFLNDIGLFITLAFWDKELTENLIYAKDIRRDEDVWMLPIL